jgi:hypothetical protein
MHPRTLKFVVLAALSSFITITVPVIAIVIMLIPAVYETGYPVPIAYGTQFLVTFLVLLMLPRFVRSAPIP